MTNEEQASSEKYPGALSIDLSKPFELEGGMAFLKRVLTTNIDSKKPVIVRNDTAYFQYSFAPGHETLEDGLTLLEGLPTDPGAESIVRNAKKFILARAFKEGGYALGKDGWPQRSLIGKIRSFLG